MVFGQLLTGSNYNDEEERIVSGRNGIGVKLCNIFSKTFTVQGCDPINKKTFKQEWSNNMRNVNIPIIKNSNAKGYTQITWVPDFTIFGLENGYTQEIIDLYTRYVLDAAMLTNVKVYLNNKLVKIKSLIDYSNLYTPVFKDKLVIQTTEHKIVVTPSDEYQYISFVNGVYTRLGGQHVDAWTESIFRPLVEKFNKMSKKKGFKLNISDVKQFFRVFVVSTVVRPEFDGQDKNKLESPNVIAFVKPSHITSILKWDVINKIEELMKSKEMGVLKHTENLSKKIKIDGLDPANKAGTKYSKYCSLFICEGLSAKTYVVAGIEKGVYDKKGRDWFGVLPVTGKLLNVLNSTPMAIANNKVISRLINTIGLKHGVDYTNDNYFEKLKYGRIILIADADVDGIHIEGLLINFIYTLYPSLLKRRDPFIISMKTPIARVITSKNKEDRLFYDENNFKHFMNTTSIIPKNIKYYKGLGTTKPSDVPDTFGLKMVEYKYDTNTSHCIQKAFSNKHSDSRKLWISNYSTDHKQKQSLDNVGICSDMNISDFINNELIKFSYADCARSLPSSIDGLKESQRKLLYAVKKRRLKFNGKSLKVAQLAGYTAEHSNYHHGEKNLFDTIIGMANEFPGTNNIPLLYRDGMFGTRLEGARDAADGRYIFTKMDALTELIYKEEDEPLLTHVVDDGDKVQPEHYVPIIPMSLINGCTAGIGTGWSCTVPCYNPSDIIIWIKQWLKLNIHNVQTEFIELHPWYRGFKGDIDKCADNKYVTYGIAMEGKNKTIHVNELPIGMWTNKFKDFVEDLKVDKKIKNVHNYSTPNKVHFVIHEDNAFTCDLNTLKLHSYLYTSNIVMFNESNKLVKYKNINELIDNFCKTRYKYYIKRKEYQIKCIKHLLSHLENKERFIMDIINGHISIMNKQEKHITQILTDRKFDEENGSYDYLLRLSIRSLTMNKVNELKNEIKINIAKLDAIKTISESEMWIQDLNEFESEYLKWKDVFECNK
jgi:DNA topoisomerase-2